MESHQKVAGLLNMEVTLPERIIMDHAYYAWLLWLYVICMVIKYGYVK